VLLNVWYNSYNRHKNTKSSNQQVRAKIVVDCIGIILYNIVNKQNKGYYMKNSLIKAVKRTLIKEIGVEREVVENLVRFEVIDGDKDTGLVMTVLDGSTDYFIVKNNITVYSISLGEITK
jgi:hypothetical protein